MGHISLCPELW